MNEESNKEVQYLLSPEGLIEYLETVLYYDISQQIIPFYNELFKDDLSMLEIEDSTLSVIGDTNFTLAYNGNLIIYYNRHEALIVPFKGTLNYEALDVGLSNIIWKYYIDGDNAEVYEG